MTLPRDRVPMPSRDTAEPTPPAHSPASDIPDQGPHSDAGTNVIDRAHGYGTTVLSVPQAADVLNCEVSHILHLIERNEIPYLVVDGRYRLRTLDVMGYRAVDLVERGPVLARLEAEVREGDRERKARGAATREAR